MLAALLPVLLALAVVAAGVALWAIREAYGGLPEEPPERADRWRP